MDKYPLTITYGIPRGDGIYGIEYWLRMEQQEDDDIATVSDVQEVVDAAYNIDPCVDEEVKTAEEIEATQELVSGRSISEFLASVASKVDIAECKRRSSGDYTAILKIMRSHYDEEYEFRVTVGVVSGIIKVVEKVTLTINVDEQSSLTLDYPVPQKYVDGELVPKDWPGTAKWMGSVFTKEDGPIPPPHISGHINKLYWGRDCTGTIVAKYQTFYDLATIEVPGIPGANGATVGTSRNSMARAFYRYQVYEQEITMVVEDPTANKATLAEVCGWAELDGTGGTPGDLSGESEEDDSENDADTPPIEDDGSPRLGCLEHNSNLANPKFYLEKCCTPPQTGLSDCASYATAKPTKPFSDSLKAQISADNSNKKINFVAIGPGKDGCGRIITNQNIVARRCCDEVDPIEIDQEHTDAEIGLGDTASIVATGGVPPYDWQVNGGYTFPNGSTRQTTYSYPPTNIIQASGDYVCGDASVSLRDICSSKSVNIIFVDESASIAFPENLTMNGDSELLVLLVGGQAPPFEWSANGELSWQYSRTTTPQNTLISSADFCGMGAISVSDNCTNTANGKVKSTNGEWVLQDEGSYDPCSPPGGVYPGPEGGVIGFTAEKDEYRVDIIRSSYGWVVGNDCGKYDLPCDTGTSISDTFESYLNVVTPGSGVPGNCDISSSLENGCYVIDTRGSNQCENPPNYQQLVFCESVTSLSKWECGE